MAVAGIDRDWDFDPIICLREVDMLVASQARWDCFRGLSIEENGVFDFFWRGHVLRGFGRYCSED